MPEKEVDFTAEVGFEVEGIDTNLSDLDPQNFRRMIENPGTTYPAFPSLHQVPFYSSPSPQKFH